MQCPLSQRSHRHVQGRAQRSLPQDLEVGVCQAGSGSGPAQAQASQEAPGPVAERPVRQSAQPVQVGDRGEDRARDQVTPGAKSGSQSKSSQSPRFGIL